MILCYMQTVMADPREQIALLTHENMGWEYYVGNINQKTQDDLTIRTTMWPKRQLVNQTLCQTSVFTMRWVKEL